MNRSRIWRFALFLLALGTIGVLTLFPGAPSSEPRVCCYPADFTLNILLFVPLGVGLALIGSRLPVAILAGFIVSAAIEIAQTRIPGRFSSLSDVISNTMGTLLGAGLVVWWPARKKWWRIVGPALAVAIGAAWVLAVPMMRPAGSKTERPWWAEWRPPNQGIPRFPGQVLSLSLQGFPLPDGAIGEWAALAQAVGRADTVRMEARIVSGTPLEERTQIAGVFMGAPWYQYLSLWQEGQDLLVYQRMVMNEWGFRAPGLRVRNALPGAAGVPVAIAIRTTRAGVEASLDGKAIGGALPLSAEQAWTAFLPFSYSQSGGVALWPLVLALGTFLVAGAGFRGGLIAAVLFGIGVLVPAALIGGSSLPAWPVYGAAGLGLWCGRRVARLLGLA